MSASAWTKQERMLSTLRTTPARESAAVTFTEKAAAEIAERVKSGLAVHAPERLPELGQLTVTTLHGVARRLLLEDAFASGFPPGADIAVGGAAAEDERDVLDDVIAEFMRAVRKEDRALFRVIDALVTPGHLRRVLALLMGLDGIALAMHTDEAPLASLGTELRERIAAVDRVAASCTSDTDKLWLAWQALRSALLGPDPSVGARDAEDDVDVVVRALTFPERLQLSARKGPQKAWPADSKPRVVQASLGLMEWQAKARAHAHGRLLRLLLAGPVPRLVDERRRRGLVSFDDLLLLRARPAA